MAIFTVHIKDDDASRAVFIKDGFNWAAFLFGPLWLLSKKLWLAFLIYTALFFLLNLAAIKLGLSQNMVPFLDIIPAFLLGLEASNLQTWKISRQKYLDMGAVQGTKRDDAERRFFDHYTASPWARVAKVSK